MEMMAECAGTREGVRPACARRPAAGHEGYVMRPVPIPCSCQAWLLHGYASSVNIYSGIREFCKNLFNGVISFMGRPDGCSMDMQGKANNGTWGIVAGITVFLLSETYGSGVDVSGYSD
jgi:hypothetical protein